MERGKRAAGAAERGRDLDQTAGIRARVDVRVDAQDVRSLPVPERACRLRLDEVVDACAAAADRLLRRLEELELGNRGESGTRLGADSLRVREVARVLERDAEL